MALDPISIGLAAASPIFQTISGAIQARKGRKLAQSNIRPIYTRPSEVTKGLAIAENNYLTGGMPGAAGVKNQIDSAFANNLDTATQAAGSGIDVIDALTKLDYNKQQQLNEVASNEAQFKQQQLDDYQRQLANGAAYSDKEFAYNKDQPYQDTAAEASALIGSGNTNVGNGINGITSIGTAIAMDRTKKPTVPTDKNMFHPLDAALTAPLNFTNKKMVFDPYGRRVLPGT